MIKLKQDYMPNHDKNHRSDVIIVDRYENNKGAEVVCAFWYAEDDSESGLLLHATTRYVRIVEEGDKEAYFDDAGEGEEGKVKWKDSEANWLLYNDVRDGVIPLESKYGAGTPTMTLQEIYVSRPEFALWYDYNKFSSRLATSRGIIKQFEERAAEDRAAWGWSCIFPTTQCLITIGKDTASNSRVLSLKS